MRAVTINEGELEIAERPDPVPGQNEILVKVRSAGINGADLLQKRGLYPAPPDSPADIPGLEFAGEVVELGSGASRFEVGDRVMGIVGGGGQAELLVVHERQAMPVPKKLTWVTAGGFPEVFSTAYDALFTQCGLSVGEKVLVHGAAGGVGTAAVQLARAAGAVIVATVRNEERREPVAKLGAYVVEPGKTYDLRPFDVVLELVGAPNIADNIKELATGGRICVIGIGAGQKAEISLAALMGKRGSICGSTLRARPLEEKAEVARLVEKHVIPLVEQGQVIVPVAQQFELEQAAEAYETFAAGGKFGKIVLTVSDV